MNSKRHTFTSLEDSFNRDRAQHLRHQVTWIPNGGWERQERTTNQKKEMFPDFCPSLFTKTVNLTRIKTLKQSCYHFAEYLEAVEVSYKT